MVAAHLDRDLVARGIVINREVQIRTARGDRPGENTDVHVDAIGGSERSRERLSVVVEAREVGQPLDLPSDLALHAIVACIGYSREESSARRRSPSVTLLPVVMRTSLLVRVFGVADERRDRARQVPILLSCLLGDVS